MRAAACLPGKAAASRGRGDDKATMGGMQERGAWALPSLAIPHRGGKAAD